MRLGLLLVMGVALASPVVADDWKTFYERSEFKRTPSYAETVDYCRRLADASPWVQYSEIGVSPQGRPIPMLTVNRKGQFDSKKVRGGDNAVFLIQAGIHSGEIDGKDAGLMLIRDIAISKKYPKLIDNVTILFLPIFNLDGHERSGPYNRANQNGPEEMGWRVTAQGYNLNRDYLKADSPEMRAWLKLYREWLPEFFADCHVTDGADYQYTVTYALEIFGNMERGLTEWARDVYLPPMQEKMLASGFPTIRYNAYRVWHEPLSGLLCWAAPPRFSEGYTAIQNRPGILIETHMLKDYKSRVTGTYELLKASLEILNVEHKSIRDACKKADEYAASAEFRHGAPLPVDFAQGPDSVMIDFLGVEYDVVKSDLTGGDWHRYSDKKTTMHIPYFNTLVPKEEVYLPEAYLVPPEWTEVVERLDAHGVAYQRLSKPVTLPVQSYRFLHPTWGQQPYEGHHMVSFELEVIEEERAYPAGSVVVDMNQRAALVAAHIFEPQSPDCLVRWGFFDTIFEQKEYIESYVIEALARKMLAEDPGLQKEFDDAKAADAEFAADPERIRNWFYRRSPYWDDRINVYPVGRIMKHEQLSRLR